MNPEIGIGYRCTMCIDLGDIYVATDFERFCTHYSRIHGIAKEVIEQDYSRQAGL
jgi:hypothetical protein